MFTTKPASSRWPRQLALLALLATSAACDVDIAQPGPPDLVLLVDGQVPAAGTVVDLGDLTLAPDASLPPSLRLTVRLENRGRQPVDFASRPPLRLLGDPALAFRTVQPPIDRLEPGQSAEAQVIFSPAAAGDYGAKLTLDTAPPLSRPPVVQLFASAAAAEREEVVTLSLEDDLQDPVSAVAFGTVALGGASERAFELVNSGNVPLSVLALRVTITPPSAAFTATLGSDLDVLAPGARLPLTVRAQSVSCGDYASRLEVGTSAHGTLVTADLTVTAGASSVLVEDFVAPVDGLAALGRLSLGQPGLRTWRVVSGDPVAGGGAGAVAWLDFDGCVPGARRVVPGPAGMGPGWGAQASVSADGLLVHGAWTDATHTRVTSLDEPPSEVDALLKTGRLGVGHGRAVLLSSGAEVALAGQPGAATGATTHGAVFLYERPLVAWANLAEAKLRLTPSEPARSLDVGSLLTASRGADLVFAGGRVTVVGGAVEPAVWVWKSAVDPVTGRTWGRKAEAGDVDQRVENQLLRAGEADLSGGLQVLASSTGAVVVLAHQANPAVLRVHVFLRANGSFGASSAALEVEPDRSFDVPGRAVLALAPGGGRLVVATSDQSWRLVTLAPEDGDWKRDSLERLDLGPLRPTLDARVLTRLGLSPDGRLLGGLSELGDLEIIRLPTP